MLTRIDLHHFKCFALLRLPLCPLTLLSGANASGKSSVIQALGLLHQTISENEWSTRLMLNGETLRLGTAGDVFDKISGRRSCKIALLDNETMYEWKFEAERDEMSLQVMNISIDGDAYHELEKLHRLLPSGTDNSLSARLRELTYLTAERLGPRETYPLEEPEAAPVVGPTGEHAASVLYSNRDAHVLESLTVEEVPRPRFRQVEYRMGRFFPGCELRIEQVPRANAVTLGIRTSKDTDFHRPDHTGFGVTQVLPIVVAALSSTRDGLLLIENPEVHLHPAGQVAMGEFMAEVAAAGVQVVLETHSDHVLNGVRRSVKNRILAPDNVALHFFRPRQDAEQEGVEQVQSPVLDSNGNIDAWPEGFFDQFDKDMNYFAGWS